MNHCRQEESDLIVWHILYKREIENYVPVKFLKEFDSSVDISEIERMDEDERAHKIDFIDYEKKIVQTDLKNSFKNDFPKFFLSENLKRIDLENRCKHHKVSIELPNGILEKVSEIEQILIKIA